QVLSERDDGDVDQPAAVEAQALELRQRLVLDLLGQIFELVDALGEDRTPLLELSDAALQPGPPHEPQHEVRAGQALLEPLLLLGEPRALVLELGELRRDRIQSASALRERGIPQVSTFPLLPLQLEIARELVEPLGRRAPQMP